MQLAYFEQYWEPVVVVVIGDHQPNPPFIIWHNYETESVDLGEVSLNYLVGILHGQLGLPISEYQQYVMELYESLPVISSLPTKIYHHTADGENRLEDFFEIAGD